MSSHSSFPGGSLICSHAASTTASALADKSLASSTVKTLVSPGPVAISRSSSKSTPLPTPTEITVKPLSFVSFACPRVCIFESDGSSVRTTPTHGTRTPFLCRTFSMHILRICSTPRCVLVPAPPWSVSRMSFTALCRSSCAFRSNSTVAVLS